MEEREIVKSFASVPQQKILLTQANTTVVLGGRGGGKTTTILAGRIYQLIHSLPLATLILYGQSYQQLLLNTVKELFLGWERLGFKENIHYVIRKMPPKHWPRPVRMPLKPDFSIFTYNGCCIQMMSEDVFNNGGSNQALIVDEARKVKKDKLDQVILTLRDDTFWRGNPDFMAKIFVSDQPDSQGGQWLYDYEGIMDQDQIEMIQHAQLQRNKLFLKYSESNSDSYRLILQAEINKLDEMLKELRKGSVYFIEFSAIDNVNVLGADYIDEMKRNMTDEQFAISVLNKRIKRSSTAFYPNFDEDRHTYIKFDNAYLSSITIDYRKDYRQSSKQDGDIFLQRGFDLTIDCGGSINVLLTGQDQGNIYRVLKGMFVKPPDKNIEDLAEEWCDYYQDHPVKEVNFIYDQTDVGRHSVAKLTPAVAFMEVLKKRKWDVYETYMPVVTEPMTRYMFCQRIFAETDSYLPKVRINAQHCDNLITGLLSSETKEGRTGFEKEKKWEKRKDMPQEKLTHFPDAFDKLIYSVLGSRVRGDDDFTGTVSI
jgi:hypothetical protein